MRKPEVTSKDGYSVDAVFFDAGMTLIHPNYEVVNGYLAQDGCHAGDLPSQRAVLAALSLIAEVHHFGIGDERERRGAAVAALCGLLNQPERRRETLAAALADPTLYSVVDVDADRTLRALRALGITVGVVSNSDGTLHDDLEAANLLDLCDVAVDSTILGVTKPDPFIFLRACESAGVAPDRTVYVGDDLVNDVLGSIAAGYRSAALYDRYDVYRLPMVRRVRRLGEVQRLIAEGLL